MGTIIAIANQKGGVGKTTTVVNLSACLAEAGRRVLLLDLDPQGNATSGLGIQKSRDTASIYEVLTQGADVAGAISATSIHGLDLLPSAIRLAGAEVEMVGMDRREQLLKAALSPLRETYDDILIDCPPSLSLLTLNALTAADSVLIPIQCEFYALEGLSQLMETIKRVRGSSNPNLQVEGVIMTMFDARTNLSAQVVREVKKYYGKSVFNTAIPRNIRLAEAPSYGLPITEYDAGCPGAQAYRALCAELLLRREERK